MGNLTGNNQAVATLLNQTKTIAVVGASPKRDRDSNKIFRYLVESGYNVVPVNPVVDEVEGVATVPDLAAAKERMGSLDLVDIFRNPEHVAPVVDEAVAAGASAVWFQLGVVNDDATKAAIAAKMDVVVDRCIYVEHRRLI